MYRHVCQVGIRGGDKYRPTLLYTIYTLLIMLIMVLFVISITPALPVHAQLYHTVYVLREAVV